MWIHKSLIITSIALGMSVPVANAQNRTRDGATVGGVAGAVLGGIIGHQNDEVPEGALIGGAVGALTGGMLGRAQDNELQRQRYQQQQAYYAQQQQAYSQRQAAARSGVSMADVISMSRSGVSETVIMSQLQTRGAARRLEVSDIISLHQQGVSDTVISAMQAAPLASELGTSAPPTRPTTTYVEQPHYVEQPGVIVREQPVIYRDPVIVREYYRPYPSHRHYYHRPGRSGGSFRISF